jgi:hypothetical protein
MIESSKVTGIYAACDATESIVKKSGRKLTKDEALLLLNEILVDNSKILDMIKEIDASCPQEGKTKLDLLIDRISPASLFT